MNKNMVILTGLLVSSFFSTALSFNQEQREVLYTLDDLEQNFASVPMITENIDMFIGIVQTNIQITEKKLIVAQKTREKAALTVAAALAISLGVRAGLNWGNGYLIQSLITRLSYNFARKYEALSLQALASVFMVSNMCVGMHMYDALKAYNELEILLALDKKILTKLEDVKESLLYGSAENVNSVEESLLNSVI
jgi:hypothetical protein